MLKAELYAQNIKGKLSFTDSNMTLYFDDFEFESHQIAEKIKPTKDHQEGGFMLYKLGFSRDKNAKLYLAEVSL